MTPLELKNKIDNISKVKDDIQTELKKKGFHITDDNTFRDYADMISYLSGQTLEYPENPNTNSRIINKLKYLDDTKDLIKQAIRLGNVEVLDEEPFSNYASKIPLIEGEAPIEYQDPQIIITAYDRTTKFYNMSNEELFQIIDDYYNDVIDINDVREILKIGDTRRFGDLSFQIIGFEHDNLSVPINGHTKALMTLEEVYMYSDVNTYTGITLKDETQRINLNSSTSGGWGSSYFRNNYVYSVDDEEFIDYKDYIKEVIKPYCSNGNPELSYSYDKFFLISESEYMKNEETSIERNFPRTSNYDMTVGNYYYYAWDESIGQTYYAWDGLLWFDTTVYTNTLTNPINNLYLISDNQFIDLLNTDGAALQITDVEINNSFLKFSISYPSGYSTVVQLDRLSNSDMIKNTRTGIYTKTLSEPITNLYIMQNDQMIDLFDTPPGAPENYEITISNDVLTLKCVYILPSHLSPMIEGKQYEFYANHFYVIDYESLGLNRFQFWTRSLPRNSIYWISRIDSYTYDLDDNLVTNHTTNLNNPNNEIIALQAFCL